MRPVLHHITELSALAVLFLSSTLSLFGQVTESPKPPKPARFYSAQFLSLGTNRPPLPANPFPDLPVFQLDEWNWAYDDRAVDYEELRSQAALLSPPAIRSTTLSGEGDPILLISPGSNAITLSISSTNPTELFDLFKTYALLGDSITNGFWQWVTNGSNGQSFTFPTRPCSPVYYVLALTYDSDFDELSDARELLEVKSSPSTNHSINALFTDREMVNVLVNDLVQDCGNEQNTQFESTCAVLGTNVIVAYVDSNQGVYGIGDDGYGYLTNYTPRLVAYAVSRDGGVTFEDKGVPPLSTRDPQTPYDDGDRGDPVLAVDSAAQVVFLAGTSSRNIGSNGIPLWKSTDGGLTFTNPVIVGSNILQSDKPWIAVDDSPGTGRHDVYLTYTGKETITNYKAIWLFVSTDGTGSSWTNPPLVLRQLDAVNVSLGNSPIVQVGPDHVAYVVWFERAGSLTNAGTNYLKMQQVRNRGSQTGDVYTVSQLVTSNADSGNLYLKRSNQADASDTFNVWPCPVMAVNPATNRMGHLYVAYVDKGEHANDNSDVFFVCSTNGGTNWTAPVRISAVWTNDQWMPVLAVKPDGAKLFVGWYDRRNDTNNSLIDVYGRFATIGTNGDMAFDTEFRITTASFPSVFAGTLTNNTVAGHYDPIYPPGLQNLHWWYSDWPAPPPPPAQDGNLPAGSFKGHVGEYNGAWPDPQWVYMSWTDYRLPMTATLYSRRQADIRLVRLTWPQ